MIDLFISVVIAAAALVVGLYVGCVLIVALHDAALLMIARVRKWLI